MKKVESELEDEVRPEYDLRTLQVRKLGPGRKNYGDVIRLEPDVARHRSFAYSSSAGAVRLSRFGLLNEPFDPAQFAVPQHLLQCY